MLIVPYSFKLLLEWKKYRSASTDDFFRIFRNCYWKRWLFLHNRFYLVIDKYLLLGFFFFLICLKESWILSLKLLVITFSVSFYFPYQCSTTPIFWIILQNYQLLHPFITYVGPTISTPSLVYDSQQQRPCSPHVSSYRCRSSSRSRTLHSGLAPCASFYFLPLLPVAETWFTPRVPGAGVPGLGHVSGKMQPLGMGLHVFTNEYVGCGAQCKDQVLGGVARSLHHLQPYPMWAEIM